MSKVSSYLKTFLRTSSKNSPSAIGKTNLSLGESDGNANNNSQQITLQIGSDTMHDETSIFFETENTDFNYEMSEDASSQLIVTLWSDYMSSISRQNDQATMTIFSELRVEYANALGNSIIVNRDVWKDERSTPTKRDGGESFIGNYSSPLPSSREFQSTSESACEIHITSGHPKLFIENLVLNLVFHVSYRTEDNAEPFAHLFPDITDEKTTEGRKDLLLTLQCLSLATSFSNNCGCIRSYLKQENLSSSTVLCVLLNTLTLKLDHYISSCNLAIDADTSVHETLHFILYSILYTIHTFIHASPHQSHTEFDFDGLLPPQPWVSAGDVEAIGLLDEQVRNHVTATTIVVQEKKDKRLGENTGKLDFKIDFTSEALTLEALLSVVEFLKSISTITKRIISSSYSIGNMNPLSSWLVKGCLVLRAESLMLLNHWVLFDASRCVKLTSSLSSPVFDKILADHHIAKLEGWDVRIDHLTVRCGILVLKLGGQLNLILPESICDFLEWLRKKYDRIVSLALMLNSSESRPSSSSEEVKGDSLLFSVSYVDEFSKPPMIYDLWPWAASNMDMNMKVDNAMMIDESSDFRLLKPSALHVFKSNLVHFTVYTMWDTIFSELLGSRSLSSCGKDKKTSVQSSKIKREKVFFLCGLFQRLFDQEEVKLVDEKVPVPFCQLYFIDFISQLIKALESQDIFYIVHTYGLFDILFGKHFLIGGPLLTDQVIKLHKEERSRNSKTIEFEVQSMFFDSTVYWLVLNEMTADYLNGLVLYSTFFSNESANIPCYFTHDDVLELIIDFVKSVPLLNHHHITYQLIKLIHNILSMVSSMGYEDLKTTRDLVFVRLISLCQVQRSQTSYCELKPNQELTQFHYKGVQSNSRSSDEVDDTTIQQSFFFASAAQSIVISMLIQLSTENYIAPVLPVFTDAVLMDFGKKSKDFELSFGKSSRSYTADSEAAFYKQSSSAKVLLTDATKQSESASISIESYCKQKIRPFVLLLLDPKTKGAGLYLLTDIIASCGYETLKLQSSTSAEDVRELKTKYRTIAAEVIDALLDIVSYAAKFPARYDGLVLAVDCLRLLSWLLRSKFFIEIRIYIQEYFRRSASISHLLFSLTKCVNSCSSNASNQSSSVSPSAMALTISVDTTVAGESTVVNVSDILKQGLTLLTCVMASHEACKDEFGLILQSSRDNADLLKGSYEGLGFGASSSSSSSSSSTSSGSSSGIPRNRSSSALNSNNNAPQSKSIDTIFRLILNAEDKKPSKEVILILFEMLLDGQYILNEEAFTAVDSNGLFSTDEDRPKIRNINIIQDIFGLIPFCETGMQLFIYQSFQNLITGRASLVNLNACSLTKPRVLDIALDLFQFISDEVQQINVRLIQCLGKHGVPVSSLKHLFRILHSKNDIRPAYSWRVIQALHGMVTEEDGPRQTFVFEGTASGLRMPPIYHWPANKAFSFCVWFKIEAKKVRIRTSSIQSPSNAETTSGMRAASAPKSYCPYILCLRSHNGAGLELFLQPLAANGYFQIVLKSYAPGKDTSVFMPKNKGMRVTEGQWHFLAFSLTSATYYRNGEASCQLDDVFHRSDFHYHKISEHILAPVIGDCMESLYDSALNTTMRGQMGALYFFSCSLSEGQLQSIHALGPDYIYNFEPFSAVYRDVTNASKKKWVDPILSILDGVITSKIFLTFNPAVWRGEAFLDNTPSKNDLKWRVPVGLNIENALQGLDFGAIHLDSSGFYKMHAFCLPGTYRSTTQDVRLVLNSLGGIKILFPLFAQLDQARKLPTLLNCEVRKESRTQKIDTTHDSNFLVYILDLLVILIDNNVENQSIFVKLAGFSIISCLLERVSPDHFSVEVVNKILDLCSKLEHNNALHEALIDQLLCNFKLWVLTPLVIQESILSYIKVLIGKNTLNIESFSFQRWVDVLSLMYDFDLLSIFSTTASIHSISDVAITAQAVATAFDNSSGREGAPISAFSPGPSPVKAVPVGVVDDVKVTAVVQSLRTTLLCGKRTNASSFTCKLSFDELVTVRSYVFSFLYITLRNQNDVYAENLQSLVSYLLHCQSTHSQIEVLKFILELLNDKQNPYFPPQVVCGFAQNNSLSALYTLFGSSCTKVRLLTVVLFATVVQLSLNDNVIPGKVKLFRPQAFPFDDGVTYLEAVPAGNRDRTASGATDIRGSFSAFTSPQTVNSAASTATSDIYESLDLAADVMLSVFLSLQRSLQEGLSHSSSASGGVQSLIIIHTLALTMFGSSPLFLFEEVVHLFTDRGDLGTDISMWSMENSIRITGNWSEFVNGEHFKEKILYIPTIFVSLVDFLCSECVPTEVRFQGVMILHATVFSNLRNCELILSVPTWYSHFIRLLDVETKRVVSLTKGGDVGEEVERQLAASRIILDVCVVSFCELQKSAVFIGKPKPIAKITRVGVFNVDISANEVMNKISRGERQLGMFVLRDNIAYLKDLFHSRERAQVSNSSSSSRAARGRTVFTEDFDDRDSVDGLDAVRLGILLLQVSMCELQREQEQLFKLRMTSSGSSSNSGNDLMQDHQEKIFHVNTWILFNCVLDFLNNIWAVRLQSLDVRTVTEVENRSLEVIEGKLSAFANDTGVRETGEGVEISYEKLKWAFYPAVRSEVLKVIESKEDSSKSISDRNSYLSDTKRLWFLLLKLCVLVQPLYSEIPLPQWMYEEKYFRVTTGNTHNVVEPHLYNRGGTLQSSMQDHVLNLAMNLPNSGYLKLPQSKKIPLSHTSGGVLWLLLRLLCSTFARVGWGNAPAGGNEALKEILSDAEHDFHVWQCLKQLQKILVSLKAANRELFENEAFYVAGKLSEFVRKSHVVAKDVIMDGSTENNSNEVSTSDIFQIVADAVTDVVLSRASKVLEELGDYRSTPLQELSPSDFSLSYDALCKTIASKLQPLVSESNSSVRVTSLLWYAFTSNEISKAEKRETREINAKLNEVELLSVPVTAHPSLSTTSSTHSVMESTGNQSYFLSTHNSSTTFQGGLNFPESNTSDWEHRARFLRGTIVDGYLNKLKEWVKALEINYRRCDSKWMRIYAESANERGPWGVGGGEKSDVFWVLDSVENNTHMKLRLRRNLLGNKHSLATQKSAGKSFRMPSSPSIQKMAKGAPEEGDVSSGAMVINFKGLKKYKNEAAPQATVRANAKGLKDSNEGIDPSELMIDLDEDDDIDESLQTGTLAPDSESVVFLSAPCEVITSASNSAGGRTLGKFEVSKNKISFVRNQDNGDAQEALDKIGNTEFLWACSPTSSTSWTAEELLSVHKRQYQLRNVAVELFFTSRTSLFINLFEIKLANKMYKAIKYKLKAPNISNILSGKAKDILNRPIFSNLNLTQAWVNRKISNFEYLMNLNLIAGRTFNDLSQYPVFPWVLRDYHSQKLDLKDPKVYRDFQWPIGAQNPTQRGLLIEKYKSFASLQDDEILPYHFGSHYSTSAMVIWYLIRMEPFTSYHVWLQDGKFDFPDRLFHSLEATFNGCTSNFQDVKEMIPEFFCVPEILENVNDFDMGCRQDGIPLRNVVLPNWAKDAHDFVRQHREALESEYVSRHLHQWVDLIFGYKQRPSHVIGGSESAINACNVFVHLTYKDAVHLERIKQVDPLLYTQTIRQIDNYGQTPLQLFDKPHPERLGLDQVDTIWPIASVVAGADTSSSSSSTSTSTTSSKTSSYKNILNRPTKIMCYGEFKISNSPILLVVDSRPHEKLVTVDSARVIGAHVFVPRQPDIVPPFFIKVDRYALSSNISANAKGGSPGDGGGHGPSPSKNGGLSKFLTSGIKEKLAGVPFASEGMLLHGSYGRSTVLFDSHEGQVRSSRNLHAEGQVGTNRSSVLVSTSAPNWIGTVQNKVNYLAEERDREGRSGGGGSSGTTGGTTVVGLGQGSGKSKKPSEYQRPSSKSISIISSSSTSTVSTPAIGVPPRPQPAHRPTIAGSATSTPSKADTTIMGVPPRPQPVLRSAAYGSATSTPSKDDSANTVVGGRARADTDTFYKSDGDDSISRMRLTQSSEGEADIIPSMKKESGISKGKRSSWKKTSSEDATGTTGIIPSKMRSKDRVDEHLSGNLFAMLADFKLLFSCGHWDNSIKVTAVDTGRLVQSISHHRELVTCVCVASDLGKHWLVSGSKDCIVIVWELFPDRENDPVNPTPDKILYGHDDCVNCISVHPELDLIASGSDDGTIILHSLREGRYLRSILIGSSSNLSATVAANSFNNSNSNIRPSPTVSPVVSRRKGTSGQGRMQQHQVRVRNVRKRVHLLMISCEGYVIAYSADGNLLCCYSVNGRYIKMIDVRERLYAMCISEDGKVVLTGGERGLLVLRWIATLTIADNGGRKDLDNVVDGGDDKDIGPFQSPIRSMYLTSQERHLIVGLESGYVRILAQDSEYLRRKLHKKLIETGILTL